MRELQARTTEKSWFDSLQGQEIFFPPFCETSWRTLRSSQNSIQWLDLSAAFGPVIRRSERKADHSRPSSSTDIQDQLSHMLPWSAWINWLDWEKVTWIVGLIISTMFSKDALTRIYPHLLTEKELLLCWRVETADWQNKMEITKQDGVRWLKEVAARMRHLPDIAARSLWRAVLRSSGTFWPAFVNKCVLKEKYSQLERKQCCINVRLLT